jgi:hypothetical protein
MSDFTWFSADFDYSGFAEAIFEDPHAEFYGPALVRPDEHGQPFVEMKVEGCKPELKADFDLWEIFFRRAQQLPGGGRQISFGGTPPNRCTRLTVHSSGGTFHSSPGWRHACPKADVNNGIVLQFNPVKSDYRTAGSSKEKYWVLPLANFVSEFAEPWTGLAEHPLSLWKGPTRVIRFGLDQEHGFIQPSPGYERGVADLQSGKCKTALTAIAVAPMGGPHMIDPQDWFLTVFLRLLDLATGAEVGAPWIELRDGTGRLVRRLHFPLGYPTPFRRGHAAIRECIHCGTGHILTAGLSSNAARRPFFSVALRHCVRAGLEDLTFEDKLSHLVRALDCVCRQYELNVQQLKQGLAAGTAKGIDAALEEARKKIAQLSTDISDPDAKRRIERISQRVASAAQKEKDFGLSVKELLDRFGLMDAEVLETYFHKHPRPDGMGWLDLLSYYRGAVIHEGFLDLETSPVPLGEVLGFTLHLHDLVVRILLKLIGYGGRYEPTLIRGTAAETVDWFKPGIKVGALLEVPTMGL